MQDLDLYDLATDLAGIIALYLQRWWLHICPPFCTELQSSGLLDSVLKYQNSCWYFHFYNCSKDEIKLKVHELWQKSKDKKYPFIPVLIILFINVNLHVSISVFFISEIQFSVYLLNSYYSNLICIFKSNNLL